MLFNLTRFIEWPPAMLDPSHPQFLICILGADPIGPDLDSLLANKTVAGKPVGLRHVSSLDAAGDCQILYLGAGTHKESVRTGPERNGVLTVSGRPNADSPGQMIGLPTVDEHVHIDVNLGLAQRAGLSISSKLLHLATVTN